MVYEKKRSGDPDYDDKQPIEFHQGGVVSAGDGVWISPVSGPHDAEGGHVNLAVDELDLDNRPEPGEVATAPSEVQTYGPDDVPTLESDAKPEVVEAAKVGQASVRAAAEAQGDVDLPLVLDEVGGTSRATTPSSTGTPDTAATNEPGAAETPGASTAGNATPAKKTTPAKATDK